MEIYAVSKNEYTKYKLSELSKREQKVEKLLNNQVVTNIKFSEKEYDLSGIDSVLHQLLQKQYESKSYITQNDLDNIQCAVYKIKDRDKTTINEIMFAKSKDISNINDIIELINNNKNYMCLYLDDKRNLGRFIIENIDCYKMPERTYEHLGRFIDVKEVATEYLHYSNISIIKRKNLILDISKATDNELIKKLERKHLDERTVYDFAQAIKEWLTNKNDSNKKEEEEFE